MTEWTRHLSLPQRWWIGPIVAGLLLLTFGLGWYSSLMALGLLVAGLGGLLLLLRPRLIFVALVTCALLIPINISSGTEVGLNLSALLPPVMLVVGWIDNLFRRRGSLIAPSMVNRSLILFLLSGWVSMAIGTVLWDPRVPRANNFVIVQLAQLAIFAFSAIVFWLMGSMLRNRRLLERLTWFYLIIAGGLAIVRVLPEVSNYRWAFATSAVDRAPFWLLLGALAGGQLLFNRNLSAVRRWYLIVVTVAVLYYALILERRTLSHLAGVAPALCMLAWLRWPKLRRTFVISGVLLMTLGFSVLYSFAGGNAEWVESGGSRLALQARVVEVSLRNPITGIGPAAYRAYALMKPLVYDRQYYALPVVNSHNNYLDLFSQFGVVGIVVFLVFSVQLIRLGLKVCDRYADGFAGGYASAMVAAWVGALVLMMFADWILPFVYNISFLGFQASVLVWMFEGGLVALDNMAPIEARDVPVDQHAPSRYASTRSYR